MQLITWIDKKISLQLGDIVERGSRTYRVINSNPFLFEFISGPKCLNIDVKNKCWKFEGKRLCNINKDFIEINQDIIDGEI